MQLVIVIFFVFGIILAELGTFFVPVALLCAAGIGCFFRRRRKQSFLLAVAAFSCLLAFVQKTNEEPGREESVSVPLSFLSPRIDSLPLSPKAKALSQSLLLGNREQLDRTWKDNFRQAGMSHVLAVSGLHIGIIYLFVSLLFAPIYSLEHIRLFRFLKVASVWLYIFLIGCPLSAVRAALMITISDLAWFAEGRTSGVKVLASAALIMLLYDTQQLWDVGFQLSFLAVLGIFISRPLLVGRPYIVQLLIVTLSAQLATGPLVAYYFHLVPLFGWVQGVLVVPILPVLIILQIVVVCFSLPNIGALVDLLTNWLFAVAEKTSAIEAWCLGGRMMFWPSLFETCLLEILFLSGLFVLAQRRKHSARRKNIFAS